MTPFHPNPWVALESISRHPVVAGLRDLQTSSTPASEVMARASTFPGQGAFDVILLSGEQAHAQIQEKGGYTEELTDQIMREGARLLFFAHEPGVVRLISKNSGNPGRVARADLTVCSDGAVLPGMLPQGLLDSDAQTSGYPFAFLAGVEGACVHFPLWGAWAKTNKVDLLRLSRHVRGVPNAAWFGERHTAEVLQEAGLAPWADLSQVDWPGEDRLWLFPQQWVPAIPEGTPVISIKGKRAVFSRATARVLCSADHVDLDCLDVGLIAEVPGES